MSPDIEFLLNINQLQHWERAKAELRSVVAAELNYVTNQKMWQLMRDFEKKFDELVGE